MGSTRFPGKTLASLGVYSVLEYMVKRLRLSELADDFYLATTKLKKDDPVAEIAVKINLKYYRGSEEDVLGRVYEAARLAGADIVVHTTGDCPMIDAGLIDKGLEIFMKSGYDCVGVGVNKSYPHGLDYYIIGMELLDRMNRKADTPYQREHVIEYVTSQPGKFKCLYLESPAGLSRPDVRITVDYQRDLGIMNKIVDKIGPDKFDYSIEDIIKTWDLINGENNGKDISGGRAS